MKPTTVILPALASLILYSVGAHALANRIDPTARGQRRAHNALPAPDCGTLPCMACNYEKA
jgi:hypothetical protein